MSAFIQQGLKAVGLEVSVAKLCAWLGVPSRTVYERSQFSPPTVQQRFAPSIKALIEQKPSFSSLTVANLLGLNKDTVHRIVQFHG